MEADERKAAEAADKQRREERQQRLQQTLVRCMRLRHCRVEEFQPLLPYVHASLLPPVH